MKQFLPISPSPNPWKPPNYFLSLWICLFRTFHVNAIIQYVAFCVWLRSLNRTFSRSAHIAACQYCIPF